MGMNPSALIGAFRQVPIVDPNQVRQNRAATVVSEVNAEEAKQRQADEKAIRGALTLSGGKLDDATFAKIAMVNPRAAQSMATGQYQQQKARHDAVESELKGASEKLKIQGAKLAARAQAMRGISNDATLKLVLNSLPDEVASPEEKAQMASMRYDSPEFQKLRESTLAQELSQKEAFDLENAKIQQTYAQNAEARAATNAAHQARMAQFQEANAEATKVDPTTGMTRFQTATLNKPAPEPNAVREYKYAQTQGFKGTFDEYQTQNANRHRPAVNVTLPTTAAPGGGVDPTIKGIAEYRINPSSILNQRGVNRQAIMNAVMAVNPDYDATQFGSRNKTASDFGAGGASGKALTAADTALAHLGTVEELGKALKNGNIQRINQLVGALGVEVGNDPRVNFQTAVRMVAPEITKAVVSGQTAQQDRKEMEEGFSANASPDQTLGAVKVAVRLLAERVKKSKHAYKSTMGRDLNWEFSPESQAMLKRFDSGAGGGDQSGSVKSIKSDAEYDALPSGATFRDPQGNLRKKP